MRRNSTTDPFVSSEVETPSAQPLSLDFARDEGSEKN